MRSSIVRFDSKYARGERGNADEHNRIKVPTNFSAAWMLIAFASIVHRLLVDAYANVQANRAGLGMNAIQKPPGVSNFDGTCTRELSNKP